MKKIFSKLLAFVLAFMMILGMGTTALAASQTGTLTINGTTAGKTIELYQMFSATASSTADGKTNVSYKLNSSFEGYFKTLPECSGKEGDALSEEAYTYVSKLTTDVARVEFAKGVLAWLVKQDPKIAVEKEVTAAKDTTEISNLTYGYYLVYPQGATDTTSITGDIKTPAILVNVTEPTAEINLKSTYPTVDKKL